MHSYKESKKPKNREGLGFLEVQCFVRDLCLRWLWLKIEGKTWIELDIPCDEVNLNLFHASIGGLKLLIGEGNKASFWCSS